MDEIYSSLQRRIPYGASMREYLAPLARDFNASGCADSQYVKEFTKGDDGQFWSRAWEAVLYSRFKLLGWSIEPNQQGPDFRMTNSHGPVLVEAVAPAPCEVLKKWLSTQNCEGTMPEDALLLRWTSAIVSKKKQHCRYVEKNIVERGTPFVIAVNSCQLSRSPEPFGISQWPYVVEAVFPIGPIVVSLNHAKSTLGSVHQGLRFEIKKLNGAKVRTDNFLDPDYRYVSAIIGCSSIHADAKALKTFAGAPPMYIVNNPFAEHPLPAGWLPGGIEYRAEKISDDELSISRPAEQA